MTPWAPTLDGTALPPLLCYDLLANVNAEPQKKFDPSWAAWISPSRFNGVTDGKKIRESIVAVWRMASTAETCSGEELWKKHLAAWVQRHHELCSSGGVGTCNKVDQYYRVASDKGYIPTGWVLKASTSLPRISPSKKRKAQPSEDDDYTEKVGDEEQDELDSSSSEEIINISPTSPPTPVSTKRGPFDFPSNKKMVPFVAVPASKLSKKPDPAPEKNVPNTRSRSQRTAKDVNLSPPVDLSSKRTAKKPNLSPPFDLGRYNIHEDNYVNRIWIPSGQVGVPCSECMHFKTAFACKPKWQKILESPIPLSCDQCIRTRKHCTLRDLNWRVTRWPTIIESEEGKKRRAEDQEALSSAREHQLEDLFNSPDRPKPTPRVPSPRAEDQEAPSSARENQLEDLFNSPDRPKPTPRVPSPTTSIHAETSVLTNINHLAEQLRLSSLSSINLACTLADTRAARDRAAATHNLISQRLKILDGLIAKYNVILMKMEGGEPTGSEKDVEMEVLNGQTGDR